MGISKIILLVNANNPNPIKTMVKMGIKIVAKFYESEMYEDEKEGPKHLEEIQKPFP